MNKKSQIGTTMTWVIASIVIFVIVILFMLSTGVLKGVLDIEGFIGDKEIVALRFPEQQQSLFAIAKNYGNLDDNSLQMIINNLGDFSDPDLKQWHLVVYKNNKKINEIEQEVEESGGLVSKSVIVEKDTLKFSIYQTCGGECEDEFG